MKHRIFTLIVCLQFLLFAGSVGALQPEMPKFDPHASIQCFVLLASSEEDQDTDQAEPAEDDEEPDCD